MSTHPEANTYVVVSGINILITRPYFSRFGGNNMRGLIKAFCCALGLMMLIIPLQGYAHEKGQTQVTYLGNEGLLFVDGSTKVLFDPFFHNDYGSYQLVPDRVRRAIFESTPPFDGVSVIVVSHAHGDHFEAQDVVKYLKEQAHVKLVGPRQAIDEVLKLDSSLEKQLISIALDFGDKPIATTLPNIKIESVRIPHAGWPQRKDVSNLVHRVTLNKRKTIMHMGDADPNDSHFEPFEAHWRSQRTDVAFPPYWFYITEQGPKILDTRINANRSVGIHVPMSVPNALRKAEREFFHTPEQIVIVE